MQPIRKPRVFLSHSKKDLQLIRRLEADLRAALCEPWIDEQELRPGQPWMDQIFSSGIPSCEVVLCYVTPNSLESAVFLQEMDARLLERLQTSRVALLLYVSAPALRSRLRLDVQRLQSPELNDENYVTMLPKVVAEIWRCFAESSVTAAIDNERVRRLEAELRVKELESNASTSIFSPSENAEFALIWSRLDRELDLEARLIKRMIKHVDGVTELQDGPDELFDGNGIIYNFRLRVGALYRSTILGQTFQPSTQLSLERIRDEVFASLKIPSTDYDVSANLPFDLRAELLRYGFVQREYAPPPINLSKVAPVRREHFKLMFTSKFDRFGFWMEHNFGSWNSNASVLVPRDDSS